LLGHLARLVSHQPDARRRLVGVTQSDAAPIPWRVYEILAQVALRHVQAEFAAGHGDRAQLEADRELLERMLRRPATRSAA